MTLLKSILLAYVRHGLTLAAGYFLAHGLIDQAGAQILLSAGLALAGLLWSTAQKAAAQLELDLARKLPLSSEALAQDEPHSAPKSGEA